MTAFVYYVRIDRYYNFHIALLLFYLREEIVYLLYGKSLFNEDMIIDYYLHRTFLYDNQAVVA